MSAQCASFQVLHSVEIPAKSMRSWVNWVSLHNFRFAPFDLWWEALSGLKHIPFAVYPNSPIQTVLYQNLLLCKPNRILLLVGFSYSLSRLSLQPENLFQKEKPL